MTYGSGSTVYGLVKARALSRPGAPALTFGDVTLDYAMMLHRVDRIAADLHARGVSRGDRVAVLSENAIEYPLVQLACAKIGAIVACQNWRLADAELSHCLDLVRPRLLLFSQRYADRATNISPLQAVAIDALGSDGAAPLAASSEDGLLIIYTSGTTGLPKAAVISHRAEIARMCALRLDLGLAPSDGYIAWAPMFHMGGSEHLLATLMSGGHATVVDGFDPNAISRVLAREPIGWLMLVPGTITPLLCHIAAHGIVPVGVRAVGCMADLVPRAEVEAITAALNAPYLDSFGATETGMPPLSGALIPPHSPADRLYKQPSSTSEIRLVGADGNDVPDGDVGEAWVRGPTLFSGYWNAAEANAACFSDGWLKMGDLFQRKDGGYLFAGRSKYLIKSGGENIYPAEIERVLLADPRVADAVVVRYPDAQWGEVPVAVIVREDASLDAHALEASCRASLAGYKRPRQILFVDAADMPRNVTGKIVREEVERWLLDRESLA